MTTGIKGSVAVDVTGTIEHAQITADQLGSVSVEIKNQIMRLTQTLPP